MPKEGISSNGRRFEKRDGEGFDRYEKDFGITLESLSRKSILDIGCGPNAEFVKYCLQHGIETVIGIDAQSPNNVQDGLLKGHYVQGDISHLPFKDKKFDLILARALPGDISLERIKLMFSILSLEG